MGAIESWDGVACANAAAAHPSGAVEYCDAMAYARYCLCASTAVHLALAVGGGAPPYLGTREDPPAYRGVAVV